MTIIWNTCWICGKSFMSQVMTDDCGSGDNQHVKARRGDDD